MKNRKLLLIVSIVLALTMSLGGTLAYLTDTDADVNTMVLGNVKIVQNEQQWNADKTELVEFEQDKPLLPYVGELGWENEGDQAGAYRRFTMKNVVDKYVTVTNIGNSNAYVRTIIALEMGDYTYEEFKMIGASVNAENGAEFKFPGAWVWTDDYAAQIDGKNYNIMVAVHQDPLAAKTTTIPSLLQVYLSKDADNEDVQKLDGNENGKYDILVISQAVQADGFGSAAEALEAGFGKVTANERETVASWFASIGEEGSDYQIGSPDENYPESGKNDTNNPPVDPDLPQAKVTKLSPEETAQIIATTYTVPQGEERTLDVAYHFEAPHSYEEAQSNPYAKWHADYVVTVDKKVTGRAGIAGQYGDYPYMAFDAGDTGLEPGQEFRLLYDFAGLYMNYEELCLLVKDFYCGAYDMDGTASGTTLTVELRLYETKNAEDTENNTVNEETGEFIIINTQKYTFE